VVDDDDIELRMKHLEVEFTRALTPPDGGAEDDDDDYDDDGSDDEVRAKLPLSPPSSGAPAPNGHNHKSRRRLWDP